MKKKLIACLVGCLTMCIPLSYATSESWSYRIDGISTSAMTQDGTNVLVGSSSGVYYLFDEYGEVVRQENLNGEITSLDINDENVILGTRSTTSATFIFSLSGSKILHFTSDPVFSVAISENNSYAISGAEKYIYRFPSLRGGKVLKVDTPVNYVSISASGKRAAAATADAIYVFNNDTDRYLVHPIPSTTSMQFLNESLIVGTEKGLLYLITETSGFGIVIGTGRKLIGDLKGAIVSIEVGTDVFVAGASNGNVYLFNEGGPEIRNFSINEQMVDCDMSSDGKLITAASPQNLYMLDENGGILWQKDVSGIKSAEMSSDGKNIVIFANSTFLFFSNWQYMFKGDGYYTYSSRQKYSFGDLRSIWTYRVSPVGEIYTEEPYIKIGVGDVNGDGENEIVASSGRNLIILNSEKKVLRMKSYTKDVICVTLMDVNSDTVPEVVYTLRDGRYNLFILDVKRDEIVEFDFMDYFYPSIIGDEEMEVSIIPIVSHDIDDDSRIEILAVVNAGYSLNPRGIFAFEYSSKNVEWFFETGPLVTLEAFCDIDQDGKPEIVLGGRSPCNGNRAGQQDDCHVYLTVLGCSGKEIWSKEISEGFRVVRVGVGDINDDGNMEIVGTVSSAGNTYGRIFIKDKNGKISYDRDDFDYSLHLGGIVDFDGNGFKEIVVTDSDGNISIYNHKLELLKTESIATYQMCEVEGINDIDGDGDKEIVVRVWDRSVKILSSDLKEKWSETFESKSIPDGLVTNVSGCGNDLLILTEKALELYSFEGEGEYLCDRFISPPETPEPTPAPTTPPPTTPPVAPTHTTPPSTTSEPTPPTEMPDKERLSRSEIITILGTIVGAISIIVTIFGVILPKRRKKKKYEKSQDRILITDTDGSDRLQEEINSQIKRLKENHQVLDMDTIENLETVEKTLTKAPVDQQGKIRKTYQQALTLAQGGQYDDAYKILQNMLNRHPSFYIAWLDLGNVLSYMGKNKEAYDAYLEFEKHTSDTVELSKSWHNRANILLKQGKKEQALELYGKTLKICPSEFNPLIMVSQLLIDEEKYDEASTYMEKAISLDLSYPQRIIAYEVKLRALEKQHKTEEAENMKLKIEKTKECLQLLSEGLEYGRKNHYEKAAEKFSKLIEMDPENSRAYYNKGLALEYMRRFPEALNCYSESLSLNPEAENVKSAYSRCAYNVGAQLRSNDKSEKAIEYFDRALEYNPLFYECLVAKGDAFQDMGKYDDSISLYRLAIRAQPNRVEAYIAKGYSLAMINEKSKALKCYDTVLKIDPANPIAIRNKSRLLEELGFTSE